MDKQTEKLPFVSTETKMYNKLLLVIFKYIHQKLNISCYLLQDTQKTYREKLNLLLSPPVTLSSPLALITLNIKTGVKHNSNSVFKVGSEITYWVFLSCHQSGFVTLTYQAILSCLEYLLRLPDTVSILSLYSKRMNFTISIKTHLRSDDPKG